MELYEESKSTKDLEKKSKKLIKILIACLIIVVIAIIALIVVIYYIQGAQFKVNIDGQRASLPEDTFVFEGDNIYVSIRDFAQNIEYTYNNGEYKHQYSEDADKCYIYNTNEIASYSLDSDILYKVLNSSGQTEEDYEYFSLDEPVKMINNKLYTTLDGISKGCNVNISYDKDSNTVSVYTLDYLTTLAAAGIPNSIFANGITPDNFENQKAILYNLMVVINTNGQYGVYDLSGNTIIGEKYDAIRFIESSQEFIVQTSDSKMGIIDSNGITKIEPSYDSIKPIDKDLGLYLASNDNKYGVINGNGRTIIYLEYEQIGVDANQFNNDDIKNPYLLYNKCIPVLRGNKWGMFDINGNTVLPIQYDGFGCLSSSNLLLIPEYQAFVVHQGQYYGLYNSSGNELIPIRVTDIYSVTSSGEKGYYLTYEGMTMDVIDYLSNTLGIKPIADENGKALQENNSTSGTTNTQTNTHTTSTQTTNTQTTTTEVTNTQTTNTQATDAQATDAQPTDTQTTNENTQETNTQETTTQAESDNVTSTVPSVEGL